eukprot:CAMPEP_0173382938 /NCGR_PEP_ID=MMETSP1356-20130122/5457_1 /TAXON_ID=77927 ORGANISM="Hemiselmis virescens, Strain PCC157" /NCGR_SAMPLE_ID=MMETSP1356 /ASSEMBLY_ACC=CAM_ASM_000847 /LENGTH=126 /DNA_ID=CAMNT_0014337541 /DNA_START=317 /DNA_END=697 /DNA_ORIENTATION=-
MGLLDAKSGVGLSYLHGSRPHNIQACTRIPTCHQIVAALASLHACVDTMSIRHLIRQPKQNTKTQSIICRALPRLAGGQILAPHLRNWGHTRTESNAVPQEYLLQGGLHPLGGGLRARAAPLPPAT